MTVSTEKHYLYFKQRNNDDEVDVKTIRKYHKILSNEKSK